MMLLTVISALGCVGLIAAEYANLSRARIVAKCVASGAFVVLGTHVAVHAGTPYGTLILVGLVLGAIGDVALLGRSNTAFAAGLGAFLLGHLAYIVAIATIAPIGTWFTATAFSGLGVGTLALRWLWPHLGGLKKPVIAYVAVISVMLIAAVAGSTRLPHPRGEYLGFGALAFYLSDFAVARDKFVTKGFVNKAIGLPLYFAGQLLIAWSIN